MTFEQVISDIAKLKGMTLRSLGRGSSVIIMDVDAELQRISVKAVDRPGTLSRSFAEMKLVWDALVSRPAVHVDSTLAGSGTSRNQPETIYANLPYVEHLRIGGRKHLALVSKASHPLGTLRKMDSIQSQKTSEALVKETNAKGPPNVLLVAQDIRAAAKEADAFSGGKTAALTADSTLCASNGPGARIFIAASGILRGKLAPGVYPVVPGSTGAGEPLGISAAGVELRVSVLGGSKVILCSLKG